MKTRAQLQAIITLQQLRQKIASLPQVDRKAVGIFASAYRDTARKHSGAAMIAMALVLAEMSVETGEPTP